jgi:hypothetical protein
MKVIDYTESVRRVVARTRAAQGLPPTVEDPAALARVVGLLNDETPGTPGVRP